jgi:hypothetical protein
MYRRVSAAILKGDQVLLVKLKEQDRLMPRATWVFPFMELDEDSSPRKEINDFTAKLGIKYDSINKVFSYTPTESPKLTYFLYILGYASGEPEVSKFFQAYKWVSIKDITAYSTSFMDSEISKYLNDVADHAAKRI